MRRLIITLTIVAGLLVPGVAIASRVATGSTRTAIERAALGSSVPQRCAVVVVTTEDGGNWATAAIDPTYCPHAPNGVALVRRTHGQWHLVAGGTADFPCDRLGVPVAVRRDLRLPCAATLPTGPPGAQHLTEFLSPDRKIWCLSGGDMPAFPFSCAANPETFPELSANLSNRGNVTTCVITHLIQQPGHPPDTCFVNFNDQASVLQVGQQNYVDGVLCKSATDGITCTLTAGTGKGKGFFISTTTVTRVGP
jgi:hypothetical protein